MIDLSHVSAWVFDMDDTLYPREQGLMQLVQARINAYVVEACVECRWNHLLRVIPVGGRRSSTRATR